MPNLSNNNLAIIKQLHDVVCGGELNVRNFDPVLKELDGNFECNHQYVRDLISTFHFKELPSRRAFLYA